MLFSDITQLDDNQPHVWVEIGCFWCANMNGLSLADQSEAENATSSYTLSNRANNTYY